MEMIKRFRINDSFIGRYQQLIKNSVIPYQEKVLNDEIPDIPKSHCIENFRLAAEKLEKGSCNGEFYGMVFQDSDIGKWLEGAAYSLLLFPDSELEKRCDNIIELLGKAQHSDGYLNTYFTVKEPERRWTNLQEAHELYCAGHLIEAAVAYYYCTGKDRFLKIMSAMADNIYTHFITEKNAGFGGHPEIELALMRLYRATENEKYKKLAEYFINARGASDYFVDEAATRGWDVWNNNAYDREYTQAHKPVREQDKAVGHAVRAVYLYTGMADYAEASGDKELIDACRKLWKNIINRRMYITGAIGSAYEGEAFTEDFHLPNDTAYGETCAAIGLIFFARQMLKIEKKSEYADTIERALYNCVLAGMEQDGTKFFYVNPLEVIPGISGKARSHPHTLPVRPNWFNCACCPPNVARLLPSIAEYAFEADCTTVYSHLFIGGGIDLKDKLGGAINIKTDFPYSGTVTYSFKPENENMKLTLAVRIPCWSKDTKITLNGKEISPDIKDGYAYIDGSFTKNDVVMVELDMSVRKVYANPKVSADNGKIAFTRGPLVYCAEGHDNGGNVLGLRVLADTESEISEYISDKLCGIREIKVKGKVTEASDSLYSYEKPVTKDTEITLIPYYSWANRGLTEMRVWLPTI